MKIGLKQGKRLFKASLLVVFLCLIYLDAKASEFDEYYDAMRYLTERDKVLAGNIANADTPKYKPKDIVGKSSSSSAKLMKTNPMHMDLNTGTSFDEIDAEILEVKPNGNAINLENELYKKSENSMKFHETMNVYNKSRNLLKTAINGNK